MKKKHAKSSCCEAKIQHYGQRRRFCTLCHRTWRIRKKKRGRKQIRILQDFAVKFINRELPSLRCLAVQKGKSKDYFSRRLTRSLDTYLAQTTFCDKHLRRKASLVMIADAMWHRLRNHKWTIYVILLKPLSSSDTAVIMPPLIFPGHECSEGWKAALDKIGEEKLKRVVALVSDGVKSLLLHAVCRGWLIQRCHFHLFASLQNYATTGPRSANRAFAINILKMAKAIITTHNQKRLMLLRKEFAILFLNTKSRGLRRVIKGLLRDLPQFRTYIKYPKLNLPATSNAAESAIQMLRDFLYRTRGFRNIRSLKKWTKALFLIKPKITCNGHKKPTN